jgi:hypothetical protein
MSDLVVDSIVFAQSPRARTRFINQRTKKKVKEFLVKRRGYKRPDFNRMILDLGRLKWTHEKIADVLPVSSASTVSEWARGGIPNYDNGDALIECGAQRQVFSAFHVMESGQRTSTRSGN